MSDSISGISSSPEYMVSLMQALSGATPTTTLTTENTAPSPVPAVSATDQLKAMERQSSLQSYLSSSAGVAVLQMQTSGDSTATALASSLVEKALSEYSAAKSNQETSSKAATK